MDGSIATDKKNDLLLLATASRRFSHFVFYLAHWHLRSLSLSIADHAMVQPLFVRFLCLYEHDRVDRDLVRERRNN